MHDAIHYHVRNEGKTEEVMDYVVVHEFCHRVHMNHSKEFWMLVEQVMPDYRERREWLKEYSKIKV